MMYPFMTLNDDTEIVHSEMKQDGTVKVYVETPSREDGFHNAVCWLPEYRWTDVHGYSQLEMDQFDEIIHSTAHLILEFAQTGGILSASTV